MDLVFRVLFHRFQTTFDWIKTELSVATAANAFKLATADEIQLFPWFLPSQRQGDLKSCSWTYKINYNHAVVSSFRNLLYNAQTCSDYYKNHKVCDCLCAYE